MTPSAGPPPSPRTARDGGPLGVGPGEAAVAAQALARVLPPALGRGTLVARRDVAMTAADATFVKACFGPAGPEVGFVGLATDPTFLTDATMFCRPIELSLLVLRRNGAAPPRGA